MRWPWVSRALFDHVIAERQALAGECAALRVRLERARQDANDARHAAASTARETPPDAPADVFAIDPDELQAMRDRMARDPLGTLLSEATGFSSDRP